MWSVSQIDPSSCEPNCTLQSLPLDITNPVPQLAPNLGQSWDNLYHDCMDRFEILRHQLSQIDSNIGFYGSAEDSVRHRAKGRQLQSSIASLITSINIDLIHLAGWSDSSIKGHSLLNRVSKDDDGYQSMNLSKSNESLALTDAIEPMNQEMGQKCSASTSFESLQEARQAIGSSRTIFPLLSNTSQGSFQTMYSVSTSNPTSLLLGLDLGLLDNEKKDRIVQISKSFKTIVRQFNDVQKLGNETARRIALPKATCTPSYSQQKRVKFLANKKKAQEQKDCVAIIPALEGESPVQLSEHPSASNGNCDQSPTVCSPKETLIQSITAQETPIEPMSILNSKSISTDGTLNLKSMSMDAVLNLESITMDAVLNSKMDAILDPKCKLPAESPDQPMVVANVYVDRIEIIGMTC
jgi:hypothetical protein